VNNLLRKILSQSEFEMIFWPSTNKSNQIRLSLYSTQKLICDFISSVKIALQVRRKVGAQLKKITEKFVSMYTIIWLGI